MILSSNENELVMEYEKLPIVSLRIALLPIVNEKSIFNSKFEYFRTDQAK